MSVIVLSLLLIIISGLVAAVCFLKWSKIKKDLFQAAAASQAPLIDEKEEAEAELLTKPPVIPEPPPPPPPIELGDILFTVPGMDLIIFFNFRGFAQFQKPEGQGAVICSNLVGGNPE